MQGVARVGEKTIIITTRRRDQLAGAGVSELAGELALAIEMSATVEDIAATIHPHPTMSEAIAEAAYGLSGLPLHVRR